MSDVSLFAATLRAFPAFDGAGGLHAGLLRLGGTAVSSAPRTALSALEREVLAGALTAQGRVYSSARVVMRATPLQPTHGMPMVGYALEEDGIWAVRRWQLVNGELRDEVYCRELYCGVPLVLVTARQGTAPDGTVPA